MLFPTALVLVQACATPMETDEGAARTPAAGDVVPEPVEPTSEPASLDDHITGPQQLKTPRPTGEPDCTPAPPEPEYHICGYVGMDLDD